MYLRAALKKQTEVVLTTTGIGDEKALKILEKVGQTFGVPTVTDIHEVSDAEIAAAYVDVLQIPAFLVRQVDLVVLLQKPVKLLILKDNL